ncbi:MAG: BlaI/MecI/CopY family transcriptional regulator [Oscillospiraceae bacterium]|nr:BlaI/MecI/CopY family transcriptional regulator [Oscillospiraceae bacterium]
MANEHISLTEAEWRVMECLWEHSPRTGREVTQDLQQKAGWNRSTTLTLLSRLEAKGAVSSNSSGSKKTFSAVLQREDAAMRETENFLGRIYKGSLSLLVSSMTKKKAISQKELSKLYAMLKELEGGSEDA